MQKFLWGAAISANQCEGGYDKDGKGMSLVDILPYDERFSRQKMMKEIEKFHSDNDFLQKKFYPSHDSVDFFHRFKADIKLLSELGINSFRFSISWPRIFPTGVEEKPNVQGLKFYDELLGELEKYEIEPIVTINHFDTPLYLATKYDGWLSQKTIIAYKKYCTALFKHYDGRIRYWITHNEINMIQHMPYLGGGLYSKKAQASEASRYQAAHHLLLASAYAVAIGKKINPENQIGCMAAAGITYGNTCHPRDALEAWKKNQHIYMLTDVQMFGEYSFYAKRLLKKLLPDFQMSTKEQNLLRKNTCDFVAFSYYSSRLTSHESKLMEKTAGNAFPTLKNPYLSQTQWGWQIDPVGLQHTMLTLYDRYRKPLFIVENGIGCKESFVEGRVHDQARINYLSEHVQQMEEAMNLGVRCIGYTVWSAIDLVSASSGEMSKRYGLVYVAIDNQGRGSKERIKKDSFYWYQQLISDKKKDVNKS